jgi:hypothetical protein
MSAALVTQLDVEQRIGLSAVTQLCDDDGDGTADPAVVTQVLDEASSIARSILWNGFPSEDQIALVVADDTAVRGAIADIAVALMGRRKQEFRGEDGRGPYGSWRKDAEDVLKRTAMAERRSPAEKTAGANVSVGTSTNRAPPSYNFQFAGTRANPRGSGGF